MILPSAQAFEKVSRSSRPFYVIPGQPEEFEPYCRRVVAMDGQTKEAEKSFPAFFSRYGSATLLTLEGRFFAVFSLHQYRHAFGNGEYPLASQEIFISMDYDGGSSGLAIKGLYKATTESGDDLNDLVVVELFDCFFETSQKASFFPIGCNEIFRGGELGIAAGYRYNLDFDVTEHALSTFDLTCVSGVVERYDQNQKHMIGVLSYENPIRDIDGMSGGAVYVIQPEYGRFKVDFAGMIIRGGDGYIYFISNTRIYGIISDLIAEKDLLGDLK